MPLINCVVSLFLTLSENCVISYAVGKEEFTITDTKLFVPVVTLSAEDNTKLVNLVLKEQLTGININLN